jgi:type IV secretory pathway TraG/TraD family ATPase VirD4
MNKAVLRIETADLVKAVGVLFLLSILFVHSHKREIMIFAVKHRYLCSAIISILVTSVYVWFARLFMAAKKEKNKVREILEPESNEDAVYLGVDTSGRSVRVRHAYRRMHSQVIGTTNAGKTESVIVPWAVDDIEKGRGLIIIDGKSDRSLLNKIYAYAHRNGRSHDVRILSIASPEISHTFNPMIGGSALEITERVFASLEFENPYFKSIQYDVLLHTLMILEQAKVTPSPVRVQELIKSEGARTDLAMQTNDERLIQWSEEFSKLNREEREHRTSGLISQLQAFCVGESASIFNSLVPDVTLEKALEQNLIIYCQLPALKVPTLGKAAGKMILQCLQSAVASRHLGRAENNNAFSVYLDDFTEYLTPGFVTLLNKSRSANVSVVFAHQAIGDLQSLGEAVKNSILTNANLKVFMRTNEPASAEYFSKVIGTKQTEKKTERSQAGLLVEKRTGESSVREVEEFLFHPNLFKSELGQGEAVVVIPHSNGSHPVRLKLKMREDLEPVRIPRLVKPPPAKLLSGEDPNVPNPIGKSAKAETNKKPKQEEV